MAALRKFLKTTKEKIKSGKDKKGGGPEVDEELERRKQQWQEDLEEMSSFLVLKSTEEQRAEGSERLVDTAYIGDRDGMPTLRAVFDIHDFSVDDVMLNVEDDMLTLTAQCLDDSRECSIFKKTMIRKLDLPKYVETKAMHCEVNEDGLLLIEMPFHLPAQRRPDGPSVVPIITDDEGRRLIRFSMFLGPDFTSDDVQVDRDGLHFKVTAFYDEEIGHYGSQITQRKIQRAFRLPDRTEVETVQHVFTPDGYLNFEILLKKEMTFKCDVTTEDLRLTAGDDDSVSVTTDSRSDVVEVNGDVVTATR